MSVENVKAFFKRLEEDEAFRAEFAQNKMLEKGNQESILKAASEAGYPFSSEELKQVKSEPLTEEQMVRVAGGLEYLNCLLTGYDKSGEFNTICYVYGFRI